MRRRSGAVLGLVLLVTLAACGSDDGPNDQAAAVISAEAPVAATVVWDGTAFEPASVTIEAGTALELRNDADAAARFVGGEFDTGAQAPGDVVRLVFTEAGTTTFQLFGTEPVVLTVETTGP